MKAAALQQFAQSVLTAAGSDAEEAAVVAEVLVWCDSAGRPNQGVWRLPILCERLAKGLYQSPCEWRLHMTTNSLGTIDAGAGQGHYVASRAMQHVIATAQAEGFAAIAVRNSNFLGAAGYYAAMAAQANLIGIVLSNSFPKVRAFNGSEAVLGTNPLAFACPARDAKPLVLDMATSALAGSTLRRQQASATQDSGRDQNTKMATTMDAWGGSKGYGLALMVEILAGVLSGAGFSHQVKSMYNNFQESGNNGHFLLAIDIKKFMPLADFLARMSTLVEYLTASGEPGQVKYPGEVRWETLTQTQTDGLYLDSETRAALHDLADTYGVARI